MRYSLSADNKVINELGHVAVQYVITENSKRVIVEETGHDYFFTSQYHVNMAWVHPDDLPKLLSVKEKSCNCNNGTYKNAFVLASLVNVNIYHTGSM